MLFPFEQQLFNSSYSTLSDSITCSVSACSNSSLKSSVGLNETGSYNKPLHVKSLSNINSGIGLQNPVLPRLNEWHEQTFPTIYFIHWQLTLLDLVIRLTFWKTSWEDAASDVWTCIHNGSQGRYRSLLATSHPTEYAVYLGPAVKGMLMILTPTPTCHLSPPVCLSIYVWSLGAGVASHICGFSPWCAYGVVHVEFLMI